MIEKNTMYKKVTEIAAMVNNHHHCSRFFGFGNVQRSHGFFILSFIFFFLKGYYRTVDGPVFHPCGFWLQSYSIGTKFTWYVVGTRTWYAYQVRTWYGFCVNTLINNKIQSCKTYTH